MGLIASSQRCIDAVSIIVPQEDPFNERSNGNEAWLHVGFRNNQSHYISAVFSSDLFNVCD